MLQGLEELISQFDSNIDIDVTPSSKSVLQLEKKLETKLEAISGQLEKLSRAMASGRYSNTRPRIQAHPYQQPQVELLALPPENLAPRLGLSPSSLAPSREKLTTKEFISWTRNRDPRGIGWEWNGQIVKEREQKIRDVALILAGAIESLIRQVINLRIKGNSKFWLKENAANVVTSALPMDSWKLG